jgi:hypothetical protein
MRAMYSSSSFATHNIFSPPRFQFVSLRQDADRFPAYPRRQSSLHHFLGDKPHTPACMALRLRAAHPGDDTLALTCVQSPLPAQSRFFLQRLGQALFFAAPVSAPWQVLQKVYLHTVIDPVISL